VIRARGERARTPPQRGRTNARSQAEGGGRLSGERRKRRREPQASPIPRPAAEGATWEWDLASGRVEWGEQLRVLFGYAKTVTDAEWREARIHPDDRERVKLSLERATIVNHGAPWTEEYLFRKADGSYATVQDRARVIEDDDGPCKVSGVLSLVERTHS
jgi:PAS domain-containing protein